MVSWNIPVFLGGGNFELILESYASIVLVFLDITNKRKCVGQFVNYAKQ